MPIDVNTNRQRLGFPPRPWPIPTPIKTVLLTVCILILAGGVGALAGHGYRVYRKLTFARLHYDAMTARAPDAFLLHLNALRTESVWLEKEPLIRGQMMEAYLKAVSILPERQAYLQMAERERIAVHQLDTVGMLVKNPLFLHQEAMLQMELENWEAALDTLAAIEAALPQAPPMLRKPLAISLQNSAAYLFAIAKDPAIYNPEKALALAKQVVISDTQASLTPAYLDTLAEAYYANGEYKQALRIQRWALALSGDEGLDVLLQHYDAYADALHRQTRQEEGPLF